MMNKMTYISAIQLISWIYVYVMSVNVSAMDTSSTQCFGCFINSLECGSSQIIQIIIAEYRYKYHNTCGSNSCDIGTCCYFDSSDCYAPYTELHAVHLYRLCSGKSSCGPVQAVQPLDYVCDLSHGSQYIHLKYSCIDDEKIMHICNSAKSGISDTNIIFDPDKTTTKDMAGCKCVITRGNNVNDMTYNFVDVRLFHVRDSFEEFLCTKSVLQIDDKYYQCQNNTKDFLYMGSSDFQWQRSSGSQRYTTIHLSLTDEDFPPMVWINVHSTREFNVTCTSEYINTTTTILPTTLTSIKVNDDDSKSLPIIVGVVVPTVILIAIVTVVIILLKRRKGSIEKDAHNCKEELPNGSMNRSYQSFGDSEMNNAGNETHNYDSINDESIVTYSKPIKKMKDDGNVPNDKKTESRDAFSDEYDRIEFENTCTRKVPKYDSLPTMEGNTDDDTYSHESNQSKDGLSGTFNEYSHCKVIIKESPSGDQSNTNTHRNEVLRNDDYSHVDHDDECKTGRPSYKNEEDSYNHINFDNTINPNRNGNIESGENLCTSKVLEVNQSTIKNSTSNCDYELAKPTVN